MPTSRIFVYGTLKRGDCRHHVLAGERFLGEATTAPRYRMLHLGEYPGLIDVGEWGLPVSGEVWEVSPECLATLDDVEEVDEGLYERREIQLAEPSFGSVQAYFYLGDCEGKPDCGTCWK